MYYPSPPIPRAFIYRRLHSLFGLGIVIFLVEHLITNSQAALWIGNDGRGFIESVNWINSLPFLLVIEIFLIGVPIALHAYWGIFYLWTGRYNSFSTDGSKPALPEYERNQAYTLQRITSWILLIGIVLHVYNMRILHYPIQTQIGSQLFYLVRVDADPGLTTLAQRINVELYGPDQIKELQNTTPKSMPTSDSDNATERKAALQDKQQQDFLTALQKRPIHYGQLIASSKDFGTAELLVVREVFKNPIYMVLYTIFVLAACFHAFNGLWTFLISWGFILTKTAQMAFLKLSYALIILFSFLGLSAIWLTYWVNLKS